MNETHAFLDILFARVSSGYLTLTAIHPDKHHPTPSRHIPRHNARKLDMALHDLARANTLGWGTCFAVAARQRDLGRWRRGTLSDLSALPALFVDIDLSPATVMSRLQAHDPPPSCLVSSGYGVHAYWWLDEPARDWSAAALALQALQRRLGGDPLTVSQSMRLPGSLNTKRSPPIPCTLLTLTDYRYPLDAFLPPRFAKTVPALQTIHTLQPLPSNPAGIAASPIRPTSSAVSRQLKVNPRLTGAVCQVLVKRYGGYRQSNGWWGAHCPYPHRRDAPGMHFAFNPVSGVGVCLGKHGRLLLKDLCALLRLRPSAYGGLYR